MKTLILAAIRCFLMFLLPTTMYAISAQWDLDPTSEVWNTAANWTPDGVPNGPADIATFGLTNLANLIIVEDTEVNGIIFTPAANNYSFTLFFGITLTVSGTGITNNSENEAFFLVGGTEDLGHLHFTNSATAGNAHVICSGDPVHGGVSSVQFSNRSTADSAFMQIENGASISFSNFSTADNATIGVSGTLASLNFFDTSTAANANITVSGGVLSFEDSSQGGTAQILLGGESSSLDISAHNAPGVTIGSIEGEGNVSLGANNLTVGSNNLSTTFSGVIKDGGQGGGTGGSLTKIGSGTLTLTGANTYTRNTNINRGVLQVDGSITSNTFVNQRGTLAGTGTINGNLTNNGTVSPGSAGAPGMLTVTGSYRQAQYATLMIQLAGMSPDQFSVLNVLGNASLNGFLDPVLLNGFVPSIGDSFVFLNYASLTGEFSQISDQFLGNGLQWSVTYEANYAILTVEQRVPDQGSTVSLLGFGLLGLTALRRRLGC